MKFKIFLALLCLAAGAYLLWDLNVALGVFLGALGACALADVFTQKANRRYKLTAIEGTFRATAEGTNRADVERELARTMKSWQTNRL